MSKSILIEDTIAIKDRTMSCGSELLEKYISPYNSSIVEGLDDYELEVFTSPKELGLWESAKYNVQINDALIGVDTKGELAYGTEGLFSLKPTRNSISMYGVHQGTNTYDNITIVSNSISMLKEIYLNISGKDSMDLKTFESTKTSIKDIKTIDFDTLDMEYKEYLEEIFHILSSVEFSANTTKFDGINYGKRIDDAEDLDDIYMKTRGEYLSLEVKNKIIEGYYFLNNENREKYYNKALSLVSNIKKQADDILKESKLLTSKSKKDNVNNDLLLFASMLGLPAVVWHTDEYINTIVGPRYADEFVIDLVLNKEVV